MNREKRRAALFALGVSREVVNAVDSAIARGQCLSSIIQCGVVDDNFKRSVAERARELVYDYPTITDHHDGLRALAQALQGVELANNDCHVFIRELGRRLGLTDTQVYDEFGKFHRERKEARK